MILRIFLVFFVVLSCAAADLRQGEIKPRIIALRVPGKFNEVIFSEQTNLYYVQITLGSQRVGTPLKDSDTDTLSMQMWLLQTDGTAIHPMGKPGWGCIGSFGFVDTTMDFTFARSSTNKPIGIVVSYRGKLFCKEIGGTR